MRFGLFVYSGDTGEGLTLERVETMNTYNDIEEASRLSQDPPEQTFAE